MSYDDRLYFNGIDAATGEYLQAPCRPEELARSLTGGAEPDPDPPSPELLERARHKARGDRVRGVATGIDPCELAEAGWGVVLPAVEPGSSRARRQQEILAALQPLLEHRRAQATRHDERLFQVFDGVQVVGSGVLRGAGDTRFPLAANLVGYYALGLPIAALCTFVLGYGVRGLWIGLCVGLVLVAATLFARFDHLCSRPLVRLAGGGD